MSAALLPGLRKKIIENGGDPERETLNLGKNVMMACPYFVDSSMDEYWRVYLFIEGADLL